MLTKFKNEAEGDALLKECVNEIKKVMVKYPQLQSVFGIGAIYMQEEDGMNMISMDSIYGNNRAISIMLSNIIKEIGDEDVVKQLIGDCGPLQKAILPFVKTAVREALEAYGIDADVLVRAIPSTTQEGIVNFCSTQKSDC